MYIERRERSKEIYPAIRRHCGQQHLTSARSANGIANVFSTSAGYEALESWLA